MKILCYIITFLFGFNTIEAQVKNEWQQYIKDSVLNADDKNFVCLYSSIGTVSVKMHDYFLKKGRYVTTSINYLDSTIKYNSKILPNLFQIVYENYDGLTMLPAYEQTKKWRTSFLDDYYDSKKTTFQLSIKYHKLHYNHFQKFTEDQIRDTKEEKLRNAIIAINQLYSIFEEIENNIN
jgi:hypothetical protein